MPKALLKFFIVFTIFPLNLFAVHTADEDDLDSSKRRFIISGLPLNNNQEEKQGVMTLCFKDQGTRKWDHAALIFEMFLPKTSPEISLRMIHYGGVRGCCGCVTDKKVGVEDSKTSLMQVYRAIEEDDENGDKKYVPAQYKRYASWSVSNDMLIEGLAQANRDKNLSISTTCVKYVEKIMNIVGVTVNFGYSLKTPENLKYYASRSVSQPSRTELEYEEIPLPLIFN